MIANALTAALRLAFILVCATICGCFPPQRTGQFPSGGLVELDENTDPRLVHSGAMEIIGTLRTDGEKVFLNRARVTGSARVPNNAHLSTGPRSGARVEFVGGRNGCQIDVQGLYTGKIYGETVDCGHQVETRQGAGRADQQGTIYSVRMLRGDTELTVLKGTAKAWIWRNPKRSVPVKAYEEVILTGTGIIGPRPISALEARERVAWRSKFDFSGVSPNQTYCEKYARTAVEQNQQNLERNCGFTGPRWHSDYAGHFEWCMADDNRRLFAEREQDARAAELNKCHGARTPQGTPIRLRPDLLRRPEPPPKPPPEIR
jgi:hypothetical protein